MSRQRLGSLVVVVLVCLVAGAGLERVRQALMVPETLPEPPLAMEPMKFTPPVRAVAATNEASERAANEALRRRVADLEQRLAKRDAERPPESQEPAEQTGEDRPRRQSFVDRMEQLKKENPEQYAEMQKRREEFRQNMEQRAQDRANFLTSVDTQSMSDEQRENHEKLLATAARVDELRAQVEQAENGDAREKARQEIGEAMASLDDLYGAERRYLFEETARAVGYQGTQASEFADQMQVIIDNTTMPNFHRRGGR